MSLCTGVVLEDDVFCGPSRVFTNVVNPRSQVVRRHLYERTLVRRGATIGANAFSSAEPGSRSLVVTNSGPEEGKTMVAANLALALAQASQRVLLVDGDMREYSDYYQQSAGTSA